MFTSIVEDLPIKDKMTCKSSNLHDHLCQGWSVRSMWARALQLIAAYIFVFLFVMILDNLQGKVVTHSQEVE